MLYLYLLGLLITGTFASVQPIVGILTAPVDGEVEGSEQFFYAFYVKWSLSLSHSLSLSLCVLIIHIISCFLSVIYNIGLK